MSALVECIESPNTVVVIDDVGLDDPDSTLLVPLLDETVNYSVYSDKLGRAVSLAPGVIVVVTEQAGASRKSAAARQLLGRFSIKVALVNAKA
jgi:hypothetical protein